MSKKITKALFPVAGMGTRMLPLTKSASKEMLPVYDSPVLDILVEECVHAGIEEIIFVTSREKAEIENYFDALPYLEAKLQKKANTGDIGSANRLEKITKFKNIKFSAVRQAEQLGDGHAILQAKHLLKDEPFLVVFGDDLTFLGKDTKKSSIIQLLESYEQKKSCVIGVREVSLDTISSYGVVGIAGDQNDKVNDVESVIEKPKKEDAPSNHAIIGKYVCTSDIWNALEKATPSAGGEIRLIDGFETLLEQSFPVASCSISGDRFDVGNIKELFFANVYKAIDSGEVTKEEVNAVMNLL